MKKIMCTLLAAASLVSCNSQSSKTLVLYYSQEGSTKTVAEEIARQTGWNIERIEVTPAYDGDFNQTVQVAQRESQSGQIPTLVPLKSDLKKYDRIYLGFPIWMGTYATPIKSLLNAEKSNLASKDIVVFCTFGSGGLDSSWKDLQKALPGTTVEKGYGCRAARMDAVPEEVKRFLISKGEIEGEKISIPDFSASKPVQESDVEIFNAACSSYQFPLGTPNEVASRQIEDGTEYKFSVNNGTSTIYVIAKPGKTPEFTEVVR